MRGIFGIIGLVANDREAVSRRIAEREKCCTTVSGDDWVFESLGDSRIYDSSDVTVAFCGRVFDISGPSYGDKKDEKNSDIAHRIFLMYSAKGMAFLNDLDGMFVIAIYDKKLKKLFLCRDRFGEELLYYSMNKGSLIIFASEIKSILECVSAKAYIPDDFFVFETVIGEETFYEGISLLSAGSYVSVDLKKKKAKRTRYWKITSGSTESVKSCDFFRFFCEKVNLRIPERPFGLLLSGGLDSSTLAMLLKPDYVFIVDYPEFAIFSEKEKALAVAKTIGARPVLVTPTASDFKNYLKTIVYNLESPFGDSGVFAAYMVAKYAYKLEIKRLVNGAGPDELLMGYARHMIFYSKKFQKEFQIPLDIEDLYAPLIEVYDNQVSDYMSDGEKYYNFIRRGDCTRASLKEVEELFSKGKDLAQSIAVVDIQISLHTSLVCMHKIMTAMGIELYSPYLNHNLAKYFFDLCIKFKVHPPCMTKYVLRKIAKNLKVPEVVTSDCVKKGFSTPSGFWIDGELSSWYDGLIQVFNNDLKKGKYANMELLRQMDELSSLPGDEVRGKFGRRKYMLLMCILWKQLLDERKINGFYC